MDVRSLQKPLKEQYRSDPTASQITIRAKGGQTEVERLRARLLWKTLIYPEGMGETFRVFIQHKGIPAPELTGLREL